jgi:hypothetical protein
MSRYGLGARAAQCCPGTLETRTLSLAVDSDSGDLKAEAQPRRRAADSVRLAA